MIFFFVFVLWFINGGLSDHPGAFVGEACDGGLDGDSRDFRGLFHSVCGRCGFNLFDAGWDVFRRERIRAGGSGWFQVHCCSLFVVLADLFFAFDLRKRYPLRLEL